MYRVKKIPITCILLGFVTLIQILITCEVLQFDFFIQTSAKFAKEVHKLVDYDVKNTSLEPGVKIMSSSKHTNINNQFKKDAETNKLLYKKYGFQVFQKVGKYHHTYVFSSYFVDKATIHVLGLSRGHAKIEPKLCQLYSSRNSRNVSDLNSEDIFVNTTNVTMDKIQEHHQLLFSAAYFTCSLPNNLKPFAVALTTQRCATPTNLIPIQYPEAEKWNFTVCVTPLNYRYSKAYELVEMIELNRILGASNFVFYNYSTGANVDRVLEYYRKQGVVEVIPWHLPMNVDVWPKKPHHRVEIHYFGQLASHNDCLYRNRFRSKYLVYTDLDEFIVPYISTNWNDLIRAIGNRSAYFFRNVFFRKDFQDNTTKYDGLNLAKSFRAITLTNFIREERVFSPRHRSKYIINPKLIETVGIHNIWREKRGGRGQASVPPEMALLHHYRDWENPHEKIKKKIEKRILFFKDELLQKLQQTWSNLKNVSLA